jgi:hypothetical protein
MHTLREEIGGIGNQKHKTAFNLGISSQVGELEQQSSADADDNANE